MLLWSLVALFFFLCSGEDASVSQQCDDDSLNVVTWNVAAVNNNPFEYWITHDDPAYNAMMTNVQNFINRPGTDDVLIGTIFTPAMLAELKALMHAEGWEGLDTVQAMYEQDFALRSIIGGFLKDGLLGKKRLASMPDRITNTLNTIDDAGNSQVVYRPTVINCFRGEMDSIDMWWAQWKKYMFAQEVAVRSKKGDQKSTKVCALLGKIKKAKYPAITEEEERISIPLQTLAQAIFDAILVHVVNKLAPVRWHELRVQMCDALNTKKDARLVEILKQSYGAADMILMQEVSAAWASYAASPSMLGDQYHVFTPEALDGKRDQNSVILASKSRFQHIVGDKEQAKTSAGEGAVVYHYTEVSDQVSALLEDASINGGKPVPVAPGDVFAIRLTPKMGTSVVTDQLDYLLASFHGDTNGLATVPVVAAVQRLADADGGTSPTLVFGLDANTYDIPDEESGKEKQGVTPFARDFVGRGLTSCWGDEPDPKNYTTFNARTFLQPQLNKAAKEDEKASKGDMNPKDFILFRKADFKVTKTIKDNTGDRRYVEGMVFPTLAFPSDHGIVETILQRTH
jgi:hypothetical protein